MSVMPLALMRPAWLRRAGQDRGAVARGDRLAEAVVVGEDARRRDELLAVLLEQAAEDARAHAQLLAQRVLRGLLDRIADEDEARELHGHQQHHEEDDDAVLQPPIAQERELHFAIGTDFTCARITPACAASQRIKAFHHRGHRDTEVNPYGRS
jgi:hypothetical protein